MRPAVAIAILVAAAAPAAAQTQDQLRAAHKKKLEAPFLAKAAWITDYDKAREECGDRRAPILAYFTRSDTASPLSDEVERGLLSDAAFIEWSKSVVLFCHVTSRVNGTPNDDLMTRAGGQGFPFIAFLAQDGTVLARHGGARTLEAVRAAATRAAGLLDIVRKAAEGDPAAKIELEFARLDLDAETLKLDDARKRVTALGDLDDAQRRRAAAVLAGIETFEVLRGVTRDPRTHADAAERLAAMKKAGRMPESREALQAFWVHWMDAAERRKDAEAYAEALEALRSRFGSEPETKRFFEDREARLRALKN